MIDDDDDDDGNDDDFRDWNGYESDYMMLECSYIFKL